MIGLSEFVDFYKKHLSKALESIWSLNMSRNVYGTRWSNTRWAQPLRPGITVFVAGSLLTLLAACGAGNSGTPPAPSAAPTIAAPPAARAASATRRHLALLVGINKYKFVSGLNGAVQDVNDMKDLLTSPPYNFSPDDVKVLTDEQATGANIVKAFQEHLIDQASAGDIVVFHFSGHGSTLKDPRDPLGYDNTIVPYDSRDPQDLTKRDLTDKELNGLLRQLAQRTQNITTILDSCFSGTGFKEVAVNAVRRAPPDTRFGDHPPALATYADGSATRDVSSQASGFTTRDIHYVLLAGARSNQFAHEYTVGNKTNGILSYFLIRELRKPSPVQRTYRDIMDHVIPAVNDHYADQMPQLEGSAANQVIFQDSELLAQPYVLARPGPDGHVTLAAGDESGMTVGSRYDIYSTTAHIFEPPEQPIANVELDDVGPLSSSGKIRSGQVTDPGVRAVERAHAYPTQRAKIFYASSDPVLQAIAHSFDDPNGSPLETTSDLKTADVGLKLDHDQIVAWGADGRELMSPVAAHAPDAVNKTHSRLMQWARWINLRAIQNATSYLRVSMVVCPHNKTGNSCSDHQRLRFHPGELFDVTIANAPGGRPVFLTILDFTSAGAINLVYPEDNGQQAVNGGVTVPMPGWTASSPNGLPYLHDVFKLIASTNEIHLDFLQQGVIKGVRGGPPPDDPLNRLLLDASTGTRDGSRTVTQDWTSTEANFEVCAPGSCPQ